MTIINGYRLEGDLSTQNAGNSRWAFCSRDGHSYYIKEFLQPVYPLDTGELSERLVKRRRAACAHFEEERGAFYTALMRCRSGNNVIVQDFFRWGSHYYAVTDRIADARLTPHDVARLAPDRKMTLIRALVFSIAWLHAGGIVHADLKPDNLLIKKTAAGYVTAKIIDFDAGFLKGHAPAEVPGDFVYLAPEARLRMDDPTVDIDEKIDIFALGILIHQLWTGEVPSFPKEFHYAFEAVLNGVDLDLSPSLPTSLRVIIGRTLIANPLERPRADELLQQLGGQGSSVFAGRSEDETPVVDGGASATSPSEHRMGFYVPQDLG